MFRGGSQPTGGGLSTLPQYRGPVTTPPPMTGDESMAVPPPAITTNPNEPQMTYA